MGAIAELGNADLVVNLNATANASAVCINPGTGGQQPPGDRRHDPLAFWRRPCRRRRHVLLRCPRYQRRYGRGLGEGRDLPRRKYRKFFVYYRVQAQHGQRLLLNFDSRAVACSSSIGADLVL